MTAVAGIRRVLAVPLALIVALLAQLVLVNRASLPGGAVPDLVLIVVTAVGAFCGPVSGMLAGFSGGLALDIAPPGGHLAGEYALVFCLVGYACGRLRGALDTMEEHTTVAALTVMGLGVAAGEAGKVAVGLMFSDPEVTGPAVRQLLPTAILYDLLLCPFVAGLVVLAAGFPGSARRRARAPRPKLMTAREYGALRLAAAGAVPKLRLANSRPVSTAPAPVRKEPKLRLGSGRSALHARTDPAASPAAPSLAGGRRGRLNFGANGHGGLIGGNPAGAGMVARRQPGQAGPPTGWLRPGKPAGPAVRRAEPGKGWLREGKPAMVSRQRRTPGKGWLRGGDRSRVRWLSREARFAGGPGETSSFGSATKYRYRRRRRIGGLR